MKKNFATSLFAGGVLLLVLNACEPENLAPIVNAGPNQSVETPASSAVLTGSANDPDGIIVSYQWSLVSGPAAYTITDPTAPTTRVENLVEGSYFFRLSATDDDGLSAYDEVTVWVGNSCLGCWDY